MKHVMYNSNIDFRDLLLYAKGRYNIRVFLFLFVTSFTALSCLPMDVLIRNNELISNLVSSLVITLMGGCVSKEVCRKYAKIKLSMISKLLKEEDVHISEEDLENAVSSNIDILEERISLNNEAIDYFLVLDRNKQIKILESIKMDLYLAKGRTIDRSLYVLDDSEIRNVVIPEEEVKKLRLGGNYEKGKLQRKIK